MEPKVDRLCGFRIPCGDTSCTLRFCSMSGGEMLLLAPLLLPALPDALPCPFAKPPGDCDCQAAVPSVCGGSWGGIEEIGVWEALGVAESDDRDRSITGRLLRLPSLAEPNSFLKPLSSGSSGGDCALVCGYVSACASTMRILQHSHPNAYHLNSTSTAIHSAHRPPVVR